jgi:hypothetical protein
MSFANCLRPPDDVAAAARASPPNFELIWSRMLASCSPLVWVSSRVKPSSRKLWNWPEMALETSRLA